MRVVLQRCSEATVKIDGEICGEIGQGLLLLLGIAPEDTLNEVEWMTNKVSGLRIFETDDGRMNRSVLDVNGEIFNIGCGENYSVLDIAEMLKPNHYVYIPPRPGEARHTLADISKVKQMLNWTPKIELKEWISNYKKELGI